MYRLSTLMSICVSVHRSMHPSILLYPFLSVYGSACLSIYLPLCLSICLSLSLYIYIYIYVCLCDIYMSVCLCPCVYLSVYLSCLCIYLSTYLSICLVFLFIYLSIDLCIYLSALSTWLVYLHSLSLHFRIICASASASQCLYTLVVETLHCKRVMLIPCLYTLPRPQRTYLF